MSTTHNEKNDPFTPDTGWYEVAELLKKHAAFLEPIDKDEVFEFLNAGYRENITSDGTGTTEFAIRKKHTKILRAYQRNVTKFATKIIDSSDAINIGNVNTKIAELFGNFDGEGSDLHVVASKICLDILSGCGGGIVEFPDTAKIIKDFETQGVVINHQLVQQMDARPYFVPIHQSNVIGTKTVKIQGVETLKQIRIKSTETASDDDEYSEKQTEKVHEYTLLKEGEANKVQLKVYVKNDKGFDIEGEVILDGIDRIPIAIGYASADVKKGFYRAIPLLLDLLETIIDYMNDKSQHDAAKRAALLAILVLKSARKQSFGKDEIEDGGIGQKSNMGIWSIDSDSDIGYIDTAKFASILKVSQDDLDGLLEEIRQLSVSNIPTQKANITATTTTIASYAVDSVFASVALAMEDLLNNVIILMGEWLDIPADKCGHITIKRDFGNVVSNSLKSKESIDMLIKMFEKNAISQTVFLDEMRARGQFPTQGADVTTEQMVDEAKNENETKALAGLNEFVDLNEDDIEEKEEEKEGK